MNNFTLPLNLIAQFTFTMILALYLIMNLQWYNYSLYRIITKHHKKKWHIVYFIIPIIYFYFMGFYLAIFYSVYFFLFLWWFFIQDKKVVWTAKVVRFFVFCIVLFFVFNELSYYLQIANDWIILATLLNAFILMKLSDVFIMRSYEKKAKAKLDKMDNLIIIAITASYGKTSIKNFLFHILSSKYKCYKSPKSVNTINGIIQDINNNLEKNTEIYIVEAGARAKGDISKIANLLNYQYAIIGDIGEQHIEYFKNIENIIDTKFELLDSPKLKKLFLHKNNKDKKDLKINYNLYGENIKILKSSLNGLEFNYKDKTYKTSLIGEFNISNLAVCIDMAKEFNISDMAISKNIEKMPFIPHRLQRLESQDKLIIDDSFNGNYKGMSEAIKLSKDYEKDKIIITCGLIESSESLNIKIAKMIDEVFDKVIITSSLNRDIFSKYIKNAKLIILDDKSKLEFVLKENTKNGDLVLFSNDAPSYI